jgi:hypothetical protein
MIISMQGNWTVAVKAKNAAFPHRFIIIGATAGNGIHSATPGTSVAVTGTQWSIAIQHDPGTGYRSSDLLVKTPAIIAGNYVFDIRSDDSGGDHDFDDLILTCRTPVATDDYLVYGHVTQYFGCTYNPCFRRAIVIDSEISLQKALQNSKLRKVIEQLYPKRVKKPVIVDPNPPDPPFIPLVINVLDDVQMPAKTASIYRKTATPQIAEKAGPLKTAAGKEEAPATEELLSQFTFDRTVALDKTALNLSSLVSDKVDLASIIGPRLICTTEDLAYQTLRFMEYDRTAVELAGGAYTGEGIKLDLGFATTDVNGNFVFRFKQSLSEIVNEVLEDVGPGENALVQVHPDILVRIMDATSGLVLFESAPYYNIPNIKRISICLPSSALKPVRVCDKDNLLGGVGNVSLPGTPNITFLPVVRNNGITAFWIDGKLSNHDTNPNAPQIDYGCWDGYLDVKGCMGNILAAYYTIRYKQGSSGWQFVNEEFHLPRISNPNLNSPGTKIGPLSGITLNVPGFGNSQVPCYMNAQRDNLLGTGDWRYDAVNNIMRLNSGIYQSNPRGPIHFRIDVYKTDGSPITSDLMTLFIDNDPVSYSVDDAFFETSVSSDCVLFALTDAEINQPLPLKAIFEANQFSGFLQSYSLTLGKGKHNTAFALDTTSADYPKTRHNYTVPGDGTSFRGTIDVFAGDPDLVEVDLVPAGQWLADDQSFCTFTVNLSFQKRGTNGYAVDGGQGPVQFIFAIQRVNS